MENWLTPLSRDTPSRGAIWLALLAGFTTAVGVIAVWYVINDRAREHIDSATNYAISINQLLIRQDIDNRLSALDRLAQRWTAAGGTPRPIWEADAVRYVTDMPGFQSIEWADATLHIRWIVPLSGNEAAQDLDITQTEQARAAVAAARESGKAILSQPFELAQGGLGIAAYIPVTRESQFDGVVVGVLRLESWLNAVIGRLQSTNYHARILLQDHEVYRLDAGDSSINDAWTERGDFETQGLTWTTLITPTREFVSAVHARSSTLILIVGLLFSVLVAIVVYLALVARFRSLQFHDTASRLTTLFQNLPGMAYRCVNQPNSPMEFVSEGCYALSGYSRDDFSERRVSWSELIHPDDRARVSQRMREAIDAGDTYELEYRILTRDKKERWMWERGRAVDSERSRDIRFEGFVRDISRQRAAEDEAQQRLEQLAHMDRLIMLDEMATGIAHEINQPLTAISLFATAGKRLLDAGNRERMPEIFDKLSQHAQRASAVIERIQSMARRQESTKELVDCNTLVEDVAKLADAEARIRDMTIEVETENYLPPVAVDAVQIQQVALNLLRNGMEAMRSVDCRDGNTITLQTSLCDDGDVKVAVIDKGCGVSEAGAKTLFTPFSTTKESGMGMGLAISHALVTAHGGYVDFLNNESGGATFFFTLPAAGK